MIACFPNVWVDPASRVQGGLANGGEDALKDKATTPPKVPPVVPPKASTMSRRTTINNTANKLDKDTKIKLTALWTDYDKILGGAKIKLNTIENAKKEDAWFWANNDIQLKDLKNSIENVEVSLGEFEKAFISTSLEMFFASMSCDQIKVKLYLNISVYVIYIYIYIYTYIFFYMHIHVYNKYLFIFI